MITLDKDTSWVALNPEEISEIVPHHVDAEWSIITMRNRIEHCVRHTPEQIIKMLEDQT